jgi:hypothetical protein
MWMSFEIGGRNALEREAGSSEKSSGWGYQRNPVKVGDEQNGGQGLRILVGGGLMRAIHIHMHIHTTRGSQTTTCLIDCSSPVRRYEMMRSSESCEMEKWL